MSVGESSPPDPAKDFRIRGAAPLPVEGYGIARDVDGCTNVLAKSGGSSSTSSSGFPRDEDWKKSGAQHDQHTANNSALAVGYPLSPLRDTAAGDGGSATSLGQDEAEGLVVGENDSRPQRESTSVSASPRRSPSNALFTRDKDGVSPCGMNLAAPLCFHASKITRSHTALRCVNTPRTTRTACKSQNGRAPWDLRRRRGVIEIYVGT